MTIDTDEELRDRISLRLYGRGYVAVNDEEKVANVEYIINLLHQRSNTQELTRTSGDDDFDTLLEDVADNLERNQ